jgi:formate dehydrogenase subunit gamma
VPASSNDEILRFRTSERQLHWAIAIPFMVSWTTAIVLVTVYNPHPERSFRFLFSWVHRASGVWLSVLPLWTVWRHRRDFRVYLHNISEAWRWRVDDLRWLVLMAPAAMSSKVTLPDQGKFNAAEKINFMSVTCTYPLYIVTGVMIWLPGVALLAWLVHFSLAVLATPLILGHIFMATINPETRAGLSGMFTGFVPREWAKHHYRRWYVETFESGGPATASVRPVVERPIQLPPPVLAAAAPVNLETETEQKRQPTSEVTAAPHRRASPERTTDPQRATPPQRPAPLPGRAVATVQ